MHGYTCKLCIFRSCNKSAFNAIRFDFLKILSNASAKRRQKVLRVSNFSPLLVVFKWHHDSEGVNIPRKRLEKCGRHIFYASYTYN